MLAKRGHRHKQWLTSLSSHLLYSYRCKQVPVSGPHDHRNCCLSESWTDLRSDSFRKECVWLGGNCRPTSCVNILSVPSNLSLAASRFIAASLPGSAFPTLPPGSSPPSPSLISSAFSLSLHLHPLFHQACMQPPRRHFHPHYSLPQPEPRQAGRQAGCPAGGPDGALASQPALGLWACRTAGRPFCGRYGRGQSWHLSVTMDQQGDGKARTQKEPCQYTADWETVEGRTHTPTCDWAAVLSLTTRRCTEYEIEGRLTWLVFEAFSVMQLHLRIIILLMRGNHIGKNSCIFLIDFWIFCYHNMPFFNQIKKIHQNTHLGFCT